MHTSRKVQLTLIALILSFGGGSNNAGGQAGEGVFNAMSLPDETSVKSRQAGPDYFGALLATPDVSAVQPPPGYGPAVGRLGADCPTQGSAPVAVELRDCPGSVVLAFEGPNPDDPSKRCYIEVSRASGADAAPGDIRVGVACSGMR